MKKFLLLFIVIVPAGLFIGLRQNAASFFSLKGYKCVIPESLSSHYMSQIDTALGHMIVENNSAHEIIDQLKKQFSILKKISIAYRPSGIHVVMSAYEPICCVNDDLMLMSDNSIVSKDFFSSVSVQDLPKITVLQEDTTNIPLLVSSLLHELPSYFNQRYMIEFINDHDVRLTDKSEPHFIIIFTADQKKSSSLIAQCELVKKNIVERIGFDKKVKWMADTRFAHYIVAYRA